MLKVLPNDKLLRFYMECWSSDNILYLVLRHTYTHTYILFSGSKKRNNLNDNISIMNHGVKSLTIFIFMCCAECL